MKKITKILRPFDEQNLIEDISDMMNKQIEEKNIGKLLIYGGSFLQASVLSEIVRKNLKISKQDYQLINSFADNKFIINKNTQLIVIISISNNAKYNDYYQVNLEECLNLIKDRNPEYSFTHIPSQ